MNFLDKEKLEAKWNSLWKEKQLFAPHHSARAKSAPFAIVMPPPNITGKLHMGHVLNLTIQDILARFETMRGKDVWWIAGLDHAAIATEAKVVTMLKAKGIDKKSLTKEDFLEHAWSWKQKYGHLILQQMEQLGIACDLRDPSFTLDQAPSQSVAQAFVRLYGQGKIYRATRMIHWDPQACSALSNEEVIYKEVVGKLYYIHYPLVGGQDGLIIATTRPETLLADVAVAVHPDDKRYQQYIGKQLSLPLTQRTIPIIADAAVDPTMGSGCLKVTPAHDPVDYAIGQRHQLPSINIFTKRALLNRQTAGYSGLTRKAARTQIVVDLQKGGWIAKIVPHRHQVGFSERTNVAVEPKLSTQWFLRMKSLAERALLEVEQGAIQFIPKSSIKTYRHWLTQIHDWCLSRQLWWGHPIPAYHLPNGAYVVAMTPQEALRKASEQFPASYYTKEDLRQDPDVLDTWFSSWLWPISLLDGINRPHNQKMKRYYPTATLVTGSDIIFFWVARMIMAGYTFTDKPPFQKVYFTGLVRDKQRRKMSKSLGNSPDTLALIKKYGADGVRAGILFAATAGNDLLFDEQLCAQGAQFVHKLWNATRLLQQAATTVSISSSELEEQGMRWWAVRYQQLLQSLNEHLAAHQFSQALILLYKTIREEFCAHYLELVKPPTNAKWSSQVHESSCRYLQQLLQLLHPFMPFITEELSSLLPLPIANQLLLKSSWPSVSQEKQQDHSLITSAEAAFGLIKVMRYAKAQHGAALEQLYLSSKLLPSWLNQWESYIKKITALNQLSLVDTIDHSNTYCFTYLGISFALRYRIGKEEGVNKALIEKKLAAKQAFLKKIMDRLYNPDFLQQAPSSLIANERKKAADTQQHIADLSEKLS